ncbi:MULTISPECIES: hypothetical protein [Solibacillus]|nr:hypothetical protein [Solibacillus isronensis]
MKKKEPLKKIYLEKRNWLSFKNILVLIEHVLIRPFAIGLAHYLR